MIDTRVLKLDQTKIIENISFHQTHKKEEHILVVWRYNAETSGQCLNLTFHLMGAGFYLPNTTGQSRM